MIKTPSRVLLSEAMSNTPFQVLLSEAKEFSATGNVYVLVQCNSYGESVVIFDQSPIDVSTDAGEEHQAQTGEIIACASGRDLGEAIASAHAGMRARRVTNV